MLDAAARLQASEEVGLVDISGRDIGRRAAPLVLLLETSIGWRELAPAENGSESSHVSTFLIPRDHEFVSLELAAFELAAVEVDEEP
jgi:hypothetical protein